MAERLGASAGVRAEQPCGRGDVGVAVDARVVDVGHKLRPHARVPELAHVVGDDLRRLPVGQVTELRRDVVRHAHHR